jgi:hypothetical protein
MHPSFLGRLSYAPRMVIMNVASKIIFLRMKIYILQVMDANEMKTAIIE